MGWFVMKEDMINNYFSNKPNNNLGFIQKSNYVVSIIEKYIRQNFSETEIPILLDEIYKKLN